MQLKQDENNSDPAFENLHDNHPDNRGAAHKDFKLENHLALAVKVLQSTLKYN